MNDITLTKQQIVDLINIYESFKTYEDFTITLSDDGIITIKLNSKNIKQRVNKAFVPKL